MATDPLGNDSARVSADSAVWRTPAAETVPANRIPDSNSPDGVTEIDPIQALLELGEASDFPSASLADQLLAWIAPRPRNPATLTQSRIVPLLGIAADMLTRSSNANGEIVGLGATALAQELRMQRALADRRATLIVDNER
jgi:hypothetical protein